MAKKRAQEGPEWQGGSSDGATAVAEPPKRRGRPKKDAAPHPAPADPFAGNGEQDDSSEPQPETKSRGRKPRQQYFEGTEPVTIAEIEDAAETYEAVRDERMALTEREAECKKFLCELMKKHKLTTYAFKGKMIEYTHIDEDQVKVKKVRAASESPDAT